MKKIIIPEDKNSICRFCLKLSDDLINNDSDIKLIRAGNATFQEVLKKLCIKIDYADYLPNGICCQCKNNLEDFYMFLEKVESNEEILRKVYGDCEINKLKENASFARSHGPIITSTRSYRDFPSLDSEEFDHTYVQQANVIEEAEETTTDSIIGIYDEEEDSSNLPSLGDRLEVYITRTRRFNNSQNTSNLSDIDEELEENKCEESIPDEGPKEFDADEPICIKQCFFCPKKSSNDNLAILHYIEHVIQATEGTVAPRLFCQYCGLLATARQELAEHINSNHNNEGSFTCQICNIRFSNDEEVGSHLRRQHIENFEEEIDTDIKCLICKQVFEDSDQMMKHSLEHLTRRHTCLSCRKVFICNAALNEHHKTHPRYRFKCPICGKLFCTNRTALREHIRNHSSSGTHECKVCGKVYKSRARLSIHTKTHFNPVNVCSHCPYSTRSTSDFRTHLRVHTNERPFKCSFEECGRAFKTNSSLCVHIREHMNIKILSCEFCDYKTNRYSGLVHHRRRHTLEKPFSCEFCGKNFSRPQALTMHLKKMHN